MFVAGLKQRALQAAAVGAVIAAVFAGAVVGATNVFEDSVQWGLPGALSHQVLTPNRGKVIELTITGASPGGVTCPEFNGTKQLTTNLLQTFPSPPGAGSLQPGTSTSQNACLRNFGASKNKPIDVTATITNLHDTEGGCTGDEALFDTTCDPSPPNNAGEAGTVLKATLTELDCSTSQVVAAYEFGFLATPIEVTVPAEVYSSFRCFSIGVQHPDGLDEVTEQAAQNDQIEFTVTFTAHYTN
jgi:hypothetical protein